MRLTIEDEKITTPELLQAAEVVALWTLDAEDGEDEVDPTEAVIGTQGVLLTLDPWVPWRALLAQTCAEACGCVVYANDLGSEDEGGVALQLVGVPEDAKAAQRCFKRMLKSVERTLKRECEGGRSEEWVERWASAHVEELDADIDDEADRALLRAYRGTGSGMAIVWDEEGEPEERAEAARAWLRQADIGLDELLVVPAPPAAGVVDLASYAGRRTAAR